MTFRDWLKPSIGVVRLFKTLLGTVYCTLALYTTVLTGCVGVMPAFVPPLTEALGFHVPNIKGVTTVGLNEGAYKWEAEKLNFWRRSMDFVNQPMIALHDQAVDWLNIVLSATAFGGLPAVALIAGKKIPSNAIKKEDHERLVAEALQKKPPQADQPRRNN